MIDRIEALEARNPGAVELATAVSLAVRAEPDLLRHARLAVGADATAEADLWWSDLVASQNATGIMLDPAVAEALRARLAARPDLLARAWALIQAEHADEHLAVRLEELVNWLSIAGGADAAERVEALLVAGANEWMATADEPAGGVRWILSALRRLPPPVAQSPAAAAIGAAAATRAGQSPDLAELPADALENWFPWLLARLAPARVRVALVDRGIEFEGADGEFFEAPDTDPVTVSLAWHDGEPRQRQVTVRRGERTTVAINADAVELTTLGGRRYTVRRRGSHGGGLDFSAVRAAHRPAAGLEPLVADALGRLRSRYGWGEIGGPAGSGKTTALCAVLDALEAEGAVVLQHFFGRGPAWWDEPGAIDRSLVAQLRTALPDLPDPAPESMRIDVRGSSTVVERELEVLLAVAAARTDGPELVVALDDPPAAGRRELARWVAGSGFSSLLPPRCSFIVASRFGGGIRDWLEDGDPYWRADTTARFDDVAGAYIRSLWVPLLRALGPVRVALADSATFSLLREDIERHGFATDGSATDSVAAVAVVADLAPPPLEFVRLCQMLGRPLVIVGYNVGLDRAQAQLGEFDASTFLPGPDGLDARLRELAWPVIAPLFSLAGGEIERLRRIVDWIVSRPPRSVDLQRLPASLLGPLPGDVASGLVGLIAAARPGFTLADLLWPMRVEEWGSTVQSLRRLYDLHLLDGRAPVFEHPEQVIERYGHAAVASIDPGLADTLTPEALAAAHRRLAEASESRPGVAPPYYARHEVAHAVATGDPEAVEQVCSATALTRRARQLGLPALAADLELAQTVIDVATVRDAVLALAARDAPAADFPRLLFHELHAQGVPDAAEYRHPHSALRPLLDPWPEPARDRAELTEVDAILTVADQLAAIRREELLVAGPDGFAAVEWGLHLGTWAVAVGDDALASFEHGDVMIASPSGRWVFENLGAQWLAAAGGGVLAATRDGALQHATDFDAGPRTLLAHTGPLTAAATAATDPALALVEVRTGAELAGYGMFVADGVVLLDGLTAGNLGDGEVTVRVTRRDLAATVERHGAFVLLRVDAPAHPVVELAPDDWPPTPDDPAEGAPPGLERFRVADGALFAVRRPSVVGGMSSGPLDVRPLASVLAPDLPALRGAWFATASLDGTVAVWAPGASTPLTRYRGHGARVRAVTTLGRCVVSGGDDGSLRLWSAEDGHDLAVLAVSAAVTACARWQGQIAWGAADGSTGLWDPRDPDRSRRLEGHGGRVLGMEVQRNRLVSWAADGTVVVLSTGVRSAAYRGPAPVRRAEALADGGTAVLWGDGTVTIESKRLDSRALRCLASDGERIAYGDGNDLVIASREGVLERRPQRSTPIACVFQRGEPVVATDADGISALAGGELLAVGLPDGSVTMSAALDRPSEYELRDPNGAAPVSSLAQDVDSVVSGHEDGTLRAWRDRELHNTFFQDAPVAHIALGVDELLSAEGNMIHSWSLDDGEVFTLGGHAAPITGLAALADERLASCAQDGTLHLWSLRTHARLETFQAAMPLVALAANGGTLTARDVAGRLYVWDTPLVSAQRPVTFPPGVSSATSDFEAALGRRSRGHRSATGLLGCVRRAAADRRRPERRDPRGRRGRVQCPRAVPA